MLSSACQQLRLLSMFVASYRLSKQKNTNTLTVLNRKCEKKKEKCYCLSVDENYCENYKGSKNTKATFIFLWYVKEKREREYAS